MRRNTKRERISSSSSSSTRSRSEKKTGARPFKSGFLFGRSAITTPNISILKQSDRAPKCLTSTCIDCTTVVTGIQFGKMVIGGVATQENFENQRMLPLSSYRPMSEISDNCRSVISGIHFNKAVISGIASEDKPTAGTISIPTSTSSTYSSVEARLVSTDGPASTFVQFKAVSGKTDFEKLLDRLGRNVTGQKSALTRNVCPICGFASTLNEKD